MEQGTDIRWEQRLYNYSRALAQLEKAVALAKTRPLSELEEQGLIQSFEFTHELSWLVMKDYFFYQGNSEIRGSRDATREAFRYQLIEQGDDWMDMIRSRNQTSHTYNEKTAKDISNKIIDVYFDLLLAFRNTMQSLIP